MAIALVLINYKSTKESNVLLKYKNIHLISNKIRKTKYINPNFKSIIETFILSIKDKEDILIFLDSPYVVINIIFLSMNFIKKLCKRNQKIFQPYISSRGSIPLKGVKKYFLKIIYWIFFSATHKMFNYKLISSSSYEANQINIFLKGQNKEINFVIPDILFHQKYFIKTIKKMKKINEYSKNKNRIIGYKKRKSLKILIPSRITKEKGVNELVNIINREFTSNYKYKYEFIFCCYLEELNIQKTINNKYISLKFLGWMEIDDFLKNLNKADIVLIPSLYESFSIAAYQSLLLGKKIIITENSPWKFISEQDKELPITICKPLLRSFTFEKLIKVINETYEFNHKNITPKRLNKYIEEEASIFNYKNKLI